MKRPAPTGDHEETWVYPASYGRNLREWDLPGLTPAEREQRRREYALAKHAQAEQDARAQAGAAEQYPSYGSGSIHAVSGGLPGLGRRR